MLKSRRPPLLYVLVPRAPGACESPRRSAAASSLSDIIGPSQQSDFPFSCANGCVTAVKTLFSPISHQSLINRFTDPRIYGFTFLPSIPLFSGTPVTRISKSSYRRACDVWCGQMDPCWSRHAMQLCKKGRDEAVEFCVEVPRMPLCQRSPTTCKIYQHPLL